MSEYNNLNKGVSLAEVSKVLGHAAAEETINIYQAVFDNILQEEVDRAQNPQRVVDNIPRRGIERNKE